uniref:Uncharacterized protein n=1 Tax=Aegilops tauschii TaxID=37682 RepID=N1QXJ9_AEGTA
MPRVREVASKRWGTEEEEAAAAAFLGGVEGAVPVDVVEEGLLLRRRRRGLLVELHADQHLGPLQGIPHPIHASSDTGRLRWGQPRKHGQRPVGEGWCGRIPSGEEDGRVFFHGQRGVHFGTTIGPG